jgi:hypothetical protein
MEQVMSGDRLRMTDLRVGETYDVTVEAVEGDGRVIVRRDDNGNRYRVHVGFLSLRRHVDD